MPEHEGTDLEQAKEFQAPEETPPEASPQPEGPDAWRLQERARVETEFAEEFNALDDAALEQRLRDAKVAIDQQQERFEQLTNRLNKGIGENPEVTDMYRNLIRYEEIFDFGKRIQFKRLGRPDDWQVFTPGGGGR